MAAGFIVKISLIIKNNNIVIKIMTLHKFPQKKKKSLV